MKISKHIVFHGAREENVAGSHESIALYLIRFILNKRLLFLQTHLEMLSLFFLFGFIKQMSKSLILALGCCGLDHIFFLFFVIKNAIITVQTMNYINRCSQRTNLIHSSSSTHRSNPSHSSSPFPLYIADTI